MLKGTRGPKPPKLDLLADQVADSEGKKPEKTAPGGEDNKPDKATPKSVRVKIDFDGFDQRVRALPGKSGDYRDLTANADGVFYRNGRAGDVKLRVYNLKDEKESVVLEGVDGYDISADGKKLVFAKGEDYGIVDAAPNQSASALLALDRLEVKVVPREEWRQEYVDAWRILRDWFYDPGMNGVDWKAMRDRYARLVPYMASRSDLDFLLGELGGELSAGHVYVERPADESPVKRISGGLLGAEIEADPSGYFRIAKIYPGENWLADFRSPLTEPGVRVAAGDYILAVDGQTTKGVDNFYRLLENKAKRVVTLLVNGSPATAGAHEERVQPIEREHQPALSRLGADEPREGDAALRRADRLHPPAQHRGRGQPRAVPGLLRAVQQGGPDPRRPLQRRRLHPRPDDRPPPPASPQLLGRRGGSSPTRPPASSTPAPRPA